MVWAFAACESRVVEVESYTKYFRQGGRKRTQLRLLSRTLVPAILHTSSAARKTGLIFYDRLSFRDHFTGSYVNWAVDYIRFVSSLYSLERGTTNDSLLSEFHQKCRRLVLREFEFESWSWRLRSRNVEDVVLLCGEPGHDPEIGPGGLTLVPINHSYFRTSQPSVKQYRREEQFKILMNVDDLEEFKRSLMRSPVDGNPVEGQQWFPQYELSTVVRAFGKVRDACKNLQSIRVMNAIRGKEERMTKEQKAERKRKEKAEEQRKYRLAHPEIPWHEHGFHGNCTCVECNPQ